jgi:hypothetical protein
VANNNPFQKIRVCVEAERLYMSMKEVKLHVPAARRNAENILFAGLLSCSKTSVSNVT